MRVHLGGDHAAYELQRALVTHLQQSGHEVIDHGPLDYDAQDDYPVYVLRAAVAVAEDIGSRGIVLGGSGNGELIAANKVPGVRAAYASSPELAMLARQHNDAHVIAMGGRFVDVPTLSLIHISLLRSRVVTAASMCRSHRSRWRGVTAYGL